jgi:hypothetical protein
MGYRSDVAYTIRFMGDEDEKNRQSFYTFLAEAKSKDEYKIALDEVIIDEKRLRFNFECLSVKWYDTFPEVQSHAKLFALGEEYCATLVVPIAGSFLRVGEDSSDIEENSFGDFDYSWVHASRQIITDWS